jgi:hypothetical protein
MRPALPDASVAAVQMILSGIAPDITEFWPEKAHLLQRDRSLQHSIAIFDL